MKNLYIEPDPIDVELAWRRGESTSDAQFIGTASNKTKQEEIREGIIDIIRASEAGKPVVAIVTDIQEFEASKGVVIKVDRELPDSLMEGQESYDRQTYKDSLDRLAGYVAVEPLIKGEPNGTEM